MRGLLLMTPSQAFLQVGVGYWAVDTGVLVSGLTVFSVGLLGR